MNAKHPMFALLASVVVLAGSAHAAVSGAADSRNQLDVRYKNTASGLTTQLILPLSPSAKDYSVGNYLFEMRDTQTRAFAGSFIGYCVDLSQWASSSFQTYEARPLDSFLAAASTRYANVTRLFGHAYQDSLNDPTKSAGFQLALWEVFNDDGNLGSGLLRTTNRTSSLVISEAQSLLTALASWSDTGTAYQLTFYENAIYQNYLAVTGTGTGSVLAIPEADSYALLLAGLGVIGWVARRRLRD